MGTTPRVSAKLEAIDMRDYYLTPEVCRILATTGAALSNWRRNTPPVGPPCVRRGKEYRYPKSAFTDYLERLTGGDPVSPKLSTDAKRKLFARLHRDEIPLEDGPSRVELAARLDATEKRLLAVERALLRLRP